MEKMARGLPEVWSALEAETNLVKILSYYLRLARVCHTVCSFR